MSATLFGKGFAETRNLVKFLPCYGPNICIGYIGYNVKSQDNPGTAQSRLSAKGSKGYRVGKIFFGENFSYRKKSQCAKNGRGTLWASSASKR